MPEMISNRQAACNFRRGYNYDVTIKQQLISLKLLRHADTFRSYLEILKIPLNLSFAHC